MRSSDQEIQEFEKKYAQLKANDLFEADQAYYDALAQKIHKKVTSKSGSAFYLQWKHLWIALPGVTVVFLLWIVFGPKSTIPEVGECQYAHNVSLEEWILDIEESIITEVVIDLTMGAESLNKPLEENFFEDANVNQDTMRPFSYLTEGEILEYLTQDDILHLK